MTNIVFNKEYKHILSNDSLVENWRMEFIEPGQTYHVKILPFTNEGYGQIEEKDITIIETWPGIS